MTRPLVFVLGTRPEAIKLAPVIRLAREQRRFDCTVIATGQHRSLLDCALNLFEVAADHDLDLMQPDQGLSTLAAGVMRRLDPLLARIEPARVVVQGDTTSALAAALTAAHLQIPLAHVEAGLRSDDPRAPFPEELNRRLIGQLATVHFAPTDGAAENLARQGISTDRVHVTGNTGIDALHWILAHHPLPAAPPDAPQLLITAHRRENRGAPITAVAEAVATLLETDPTLRAVFALHPHPDAGDPVRRRLAGHPRVTLLDAPDYPTFVGLMARSRLILTDSGGVQEEAPALGKPVLVLRNTTERPEGLAAGAAELVGHDRSRIVEAARRLLEDETAYARMAQVRTLYGDGRAAERICDLLAQ